MAYYVKESIHATLCSFQPISAQRDRQKIEVTNECAGVLLKARESLEYNYSNDSSSNNNRRRKSSKVASDYQSLLTINADRCF